MAPRSCRTAEGTPSTAEPARSRSLVPAELTEQRPQSLSSMRLFTVDMLGSRALVIRLPKPSYAETTSLDHSSDLRRAVSSTTSWIVDPLMAL